ncbi:hypothetical protein FVE85_5936 [Porphyridium purpureum]|uniref:Uncharacterized protein n=1 Tax=Porphyridium purpureum TaxID=35688 RepID=A0A5J4Z398_PORPP|nr:hypothetical protein FVE85_5936 [Porphyridium purpureum]|eukprot:POR0009..scf295_1
MQSGAIGPRGLVESRETSSGSSAWLGMEPALADSESSVAIRAAAVINSHADVASAAGGWMIELSTKPFGGRIARANFDAVCRAFQELVREDAIDLSVVRDVLRIIHQTRILAVHPKCDLRQSGQIEAAVVDELREWLDVLSQLLVNSLDHVTGTTNPETAPHADAIMLPYTSYRRSK